MQKELSYRLCAIAREGFCINPSRSLDLAAAVRIEVDLQSLKQIFAPEGSHEPQDQWGIFEWHRYDYWRDHLDLNDYMDAPAITLNGTETSLKICDGRHRLQALNDSGHSKIQIAVPRCQETKIVHLLAQAKDARASRPSS
ncbi:MAG: hypothetical protein CVU36_12700 [Betaproteobacteria bacterium HGW-Betaproteobacteria-9]|jgi:hypothetical protein|nr:MAG: hypothetical protein CVU36_12700 [Betaproteobacteria bacterium HGW-Betaproteobacteria-9]